MSTRSVVTFCQGTEEHSVYRHYDGDPKSVATDLWALFQSGAVWPLPRFEADEAAAGFIATFKRSAGGYRLSPGPEASGDLAFWYCISQAKNGQVLLSVFRPMDEGERIARGSVIVIRSGSRYSRLWSGRLKDAAYDDDGECDFAAHAA